MFRTITIGLLVSLAFAASPTLARAQYGAAVFMPQNARSMFPPFNYQYNFGLMAQSPYGQGSFGMTFPYWAYPAFSSPRSYSSYAGPAAWQSGSMTSSGYLSGGTYAGMGYNAQAAQRDLAAAQQAASRSIRQDSARDLIDAQWAYEKLGVTGVSAVQGANNQAEELQKALAIKDKAEVASGVALNRILVAIVVAEGKGAKGVAPFLSPQLLDEVRFGGGPAADLLNLARQSRKIPFPAAFAAPAFQDLRTALEKDFASAVAPLLIGKPIDPLKVLQLEATLKKVQAAAPPVIRELPFEDAIASRRFLNQFDAAVGALKGGGINGLVNVKWPTEGTNVSELVKHLTRFKVMFGAAPQGSEAVYLALHRAMATYLFTLSQAKK